MRRRLALWTLVVVVAAATVAQVSWAAKKPCKPRTTPCTSTPATTCNPCADDSNCQAIPGLPSLFIAKQEVVLDLTTYGSRPKSEASCEACADGTQYSYPPVDSVYGPNDVLTSQNLAVGAISCCHTEQMCIETTDGRLFRGTQGNSQSPLVIVPYPVCLGQGCYMIGILVTPTNSTAGLIEVGTGRVLTEGDQRNADGTLKNISADWYIPIRSISCKGCRSALDLCFYPPEQPPLPTAAPPVTTTALDCTLLINYFTCVDLGLIPPLNCSLVENVLDCIELGLRPPLNCYYAEYWLCIQLNVTTPLNCNPSSPDFNLVGCLSTGQTSCSLDTAACTVCEALGIPSNCVTDLANSQTTTTVAGPTTTTVSTACASVAANDFAACYTDSASYDACISEGCITPFTNCTDATTPLNDCLAIVGNTIANCTNESTEAQRAQAVGVCTNSCPTNLSNLLNLGLEVLCIQLDPNAGSCTNVLNLNLNQYILCVQAGQVLQGVIPSECTTAAGANNTLCGILNGLAGTNGTLPPVLSILNGLGGSQLPTGGLTGALPGGLLGGLGLRSTQHSLYSNLMWTNIAMSRAAMQTRPRPPTAAEVFRQQRTRQLIEERERKRAQDQHEQEQQKEKERKEREKMRRQSLYNTPGGFGDGGWQQGGGGHFQAPQHRQSQYFPQSPQLPISQHMLAPNQMNAGFGGGSYSARRGPPFLPPWQS